MKLIQGDCLEEMRKLAEEDIKVDLVLTDPPYGTTVCKWDNIIPFKPMWECLDNLTYDDSPILLFGTEPFSSHLRLSNIKYYKYDWIWDKQVGTGRFTQKYQPLNNYEEIMVFYKKSGKYFPQMEKAKTNKSFKRNNVSSNTYGIDIPPQEYKDNGLRFPNRLISFNNQIGECNNFHRKHPSQKPVDLLKYLIKTYSNDGDTVLDFTMGSGSTGVACINTNRQFIGIELDENYYNIAKQRINEANEQKKLV